MVKVVESCRVGPPKDSIKEPSSLRLTFFDVIWLQVPPVRRLFFYKLPNDESNSTCTTHSFYNSTLPNLKHSLSLALQLFYPLAGNINYSSDSGDYEIRYSPGDSVQLTVAESESESDFIRLSSDEPRQAPDLHPFVAQLPHSGVLPTPVLALQVTYFPNSGISIGISIHHAAADGWSSTHFMKSWASIFKSGDASSVHCLPVYDRTATAKLDWILRDYFREMETVKTEENFDAVKVKVADHPLRATFVLTRADLMRLKQRVNASIPLPHVSSFVVTCAYVWTSLLRARGLVEKPNGSETAHFLFAVDCRSRLDPPLPVTYFGNCIGACYVEAKRAELEADNGLSVAAEAMVKAIGGLQGDGFLRGAECWIKRFLELVRERPISVAGSPKFRIYETDFGWGKPEKVEIISIEGTGAMSLAESRLEEGGLELGLVLPKMEMEAFACLFKEGLNS